MSELEVLEEIASCLVGNKSEDEIDEAERDYQAATDYQQYCETYEQTYDPETGAM